MGKEKKDKTIASTPGTNTQTNPLLLAQEKFLSSLDKNTRQNFFSNKYTTPEERATVWSNQAELGESLVNKYAWATPDARALNILKHFSPLVEIGCGCNGYWSKLMHEFGGIDVIAYDAFVDEGGGKISKEQDDDEEENIKAGKRKRGNDENVGKESNSMASAKSSFQVLKGGPEVLSSDAISNSDRTLFLCYPDEEDSSSTLLPMEGYPVKASHDDDANNDDDANCKEEDEGGNEDEEKNDEDVEEEEENMREIMPMPMSLGYQCLENYTGNTIIHVGELYTDNTLSLEQAPWGRSSSPEFQQRLASEFHCILKAKLTNWLHVKDTISVWKRSERCSIVFQGDDDSREEEEEVEYRHIPVGEILPMDVAAPDFKHLLQ